MSTDAPPLLNTLQQPIGPSLPNWVAPPAPRAVTLTGRFCRLEPLDVEQHAAELFAALGPDGSIASWTYLPYGPFENFDIYRQWLQQQSGSDPLFFAIVDQASQQAVGVASYLRIQPSAGSIEVGHLHYSPMLQRKPAATEAMALMMGHAFALGYRRYEWKCNALNQASRAAALRLGFQYEGTFRQAAVLKGHNRDTAWFSVIDSEWPTLKAAYDCWLDVDNFDTNGQQLHSLKTLIATTNLREKS